MSAKDGKPCERCGTSEWGSRGRCKQCARDNAAKWRKTNPERHRENSRRWARENQEAVKENKRQYGKANAEAIKDKKHKHYEVNKETIRESHRQYRHKNRESDNEKKRRWHEANKEADNERRRRHYEANKEAAKEHQRQWKRSNPDTVRAANQRRRTRKAGNGGSYTAAEWKTLCEQYNNRCLACGKGDVKLTVDHVIPLSMGGSSDIDNIQPLCLSCNVRKHGKHIDYRAKSGILRWIQRKLFD